MTKIIKHLNIKTLIFRTTKYPGLIKIWNKVGGYSEEFSPTGGDDRFCI